MLWILGLVWLVVLGRMVLEDSIRLELWLDRIGRALTRSMDRTDRRGR